MRPGQGRGHSSIQVRKDPFSTGGQRLRGEHPVSKRGGIQFGQGVQEPFIHRRACGISLAHDACLFSEGDFPGLQINDHGHDGPAGTAGEQRKKQKRKPAKGAGRGLAPVGRAAQGFQDQELDEYQGVSPSWPGKESRCILKPEMHPEAAHGWSGLCLGSGNGSGTTGQTCPVR